MEEEMAFFRFAIRHSLFAIRQPVIEKRLQPRPPSRIVYRAVGEMGGARLGARQKRALVAAGGPQADGGVGDVGVELQRIGVAMAEGLYRKAVAFRQKLGAAR